MCYNLILANIMPDIAPRFGMRIKGPDRYS